MRIVLVVVDSLRADAPSFAGGPCRTPFLDALAGQGVWLHRASSSAAWTVPAVASMLTSVYAHRLGLYRWEQPLPASAPNLFSTLAARGYDIGSFVFDPDYLLVSSPEARVMGSSQDHDGVIGWLRRCTSPDLFAFIHVWGTHFPYVDRPLSVRSWRRLSDRVLGAWRREPARLRPKVQALYRRAVERFSETLLPRIAEAARAHEGPEGTLLVVTADHGESFGERLQGHVGSVFDLHGNHLHEEVLSVPLVMWGPGWLRPAVLAGTARAIDLAPTLAEFAGTSMAGGDGASIRACLLGRAPLVEVPCIAASSRDFVSMPEPTPVTREQLWRQLCWRLGPWKLMWWPERDLRVVYRLDSDPGECAALAPGAGEPACGWHELQGAWQQATCAAAPDIAEVRLRRLGYIE
jgi:arylsulfatase A-like enzyme